MVHARMMVQKILPVEMKVFPLESGKKLIEERRMDRQDRSPVAASEARFRPLDYRYYAHRAL